MDVLNFNKSKLRKALLTLYFSNPEKEFYLRELERLIGSSVGNIRTEINRLEKEGLFKKEKKGNLLCYSLNKRFPLYDELKSIIYKTIGIQGLLGKKLAGIKGIKLSFIFGSFASGQEMFDSDIDLMLIGDINEIELIKSLKVVEEKSRRIINYTIYSVAEFKEKVKGKEIFILNIIKEKKLFLIGSQNELKNIC